MTDQEDRQATPLRLPVEQLQPGDLLQPRNRGSRPGHRVERVIVAGKTTTLVLCGGQHMPWPTGTLLTIIRQSESNQP